MTSSNTIIMVLSKLTTDSAKIYKNTPELELGGGGESVRYSSWSTLWYGLVTTLPLGQSAFIYHQSSQAIIEI